MKARDVNVRFGDLASHRMEESSLAEYPHKLPYTQLVTCDKVGIIDCAPEVETRSLMSGEQLSGGLVVNFVEGRGVWCPCGSQFHKIRLNLSESGVARWERVARIVQRTYPSLTEQRPEFGAHHKQEVARSSISLTSVLNADGDEGASTESHLGDSSAEGHAPAARSFIRSNGDANIIGQQMQNGPKTGVKHHKPDRLEVTRSEEACGESVNMVEQGETETKSIMTEKQRLHLLSENSFRYDLRLWPEVKPLYRAVNFQMDDFLRPYLSYIIPYGGFVDRFSWFLLAVLLALTMAYGGIHMSVWTHDFPTEEERWMWRGSSIVVAAFGWFVAVVVILFSMWDEFQPVWRGGIVVLGIVSIFVCGLLLCAASRIFIVVESFISLRTVPVGVYVAIPWANYIPHI